MIDLTRTLKEVEQTLRDCDKKGMSISEISKYMNITNGQQFKYRQKLGIFKVKKISTPKKPVEQKVVVKPKKQPKVDIKVSARKTPEVITKVMPKKLPEVDTKVSGKCAPFKCPICDSEVKKNNNIFQCTRKGCTYKEVSSGPNHFPLMMDWGMAKAEYDGIMDPKIISEETNKF
jgi:hypothetical protein